MARLLVFPKLVFEAFFRDETDEIKVLVRSLSEGSCSEPSQGTRLMKSRGLFQGRN